MTHLEQRIRLITADPEHYPQTSRSESKSNADWILSFATRMSADWQNITAKMENGDRFWVAETLVFWGLAERDFRPAKVEMRRNLLTGVRERHEEGCRCFFRLKPEALEVST